MPDPLESLVPGLRVGERVTLVVDLPEGARDVLGFVVELDGDRVVVEDRRGDLIPFERASVRLGKRMGVALGRNPVRTPRSVLDAHADAVGAVGTPHVARISDLLAGRPFPASVPPRGERRTFVGVEARVDGEWVTLAQPSLDAAVAASWWATRAGARSVQVRTEDGSASLALQDAGFVRLS